MKKFFAAILALLLAGWTANLFAEIEVKYDRFKGQTIVQTKPTPPIRGTPELVLIAIYSGEKLLKSPDQILMGFTSESNSWQYISCNDTDILADGISFNLGNAQHDGTVGKGYVLERLSYFIDFPTIKKWAVAAKVEVSICASEFSLNDKEMADIKSFVLLLTPK